MRRVFNNKIWVIDRHTFVFLYNCETWTLTKKLENTIDSFQRRLLRIVVLNFKWPNIATNETVYDVTRQIPWSQVITFASEAMSVLSLQVKKENIDFDDKNIIKKKKKKKRK